MGGCVTVSSEQIFYRSVVKDVIDENEWRMKSCQENSYVSLDFVSKRPHVT